ncbi:AAA family ATPase [Formosa sp. 4Alg 33]|uniref:ATP-binding protein n=1 Tax=Formosa sp. 4Alg 33 TaxID=3382189 RepID=UPI003D9C0FAA
MQKIQSITLQNFKFFYDTEDNQTQNKIELNQNNLLLYGENGSGKSSIYWGLYTLLQSCFKKDVDISKYFNSNDPENLRNRFADETANSAIKIEIISPTGISTKEISNTRLETNKRSDTTINKIIAGSDFINYKYLAKLYDFRNSEEIDLFEWFEREVLMFIDFEESYTDNAGVLSKSTLASDWWNYIKEAPKTLRPNTKNKNTPNRSSDEYKRYMDSTIPKFVELIKLFLLKITTKTNEYLTNSFNEIFHIKFETDLIECNYNNWLGSNADVTRPKIRLTVIFNHSKLSINNKNIQKPHTFLNEARLTAIALAIRLAMLDERLYDPNSASLLVLDDLLLSLDMSHRDKVLDIILKKVDEYQILILTHDRAFYNLCKRRIDNNLKINNTYKWEFKEMYQDSTDDDIPIPFITDCKSYFSLAKKYFKEFDYPACANYLRKDCEKVLRNLLPHNKTIKQSDGKGKGSEQLMLNSLMNKFQEYYESIGGDYTPFEKLHEYKDLLMNPLSHHNSESPIYRQELVNTFEILKKLNKLKLIRYHKDLNDEFPFIIKHVDSNGDFWEYILYLKSEFVLIKEINGEIILNNPMCYFKSRKNITKNLPSENVNFLLKLKGGFGSIKHFLGFKTSTAFTPLELLSAINLKGTSLMSEVN